MTRCRLSGRCIGGSGSEMSSKAIVSRMPANNSSGSGAESPSGCNRAWRMASSGSSRGVERFGRVNHPGPPGRKALQAEAFAVPGEDRGSGAVDFEHETGAGHRFLASYLRFSCRRSNATLTAPRRPALAACSMASAKRSRGYVTLTRRSSPAASTTCMDKVEAVPAACGWLWSVGVGAQRAGSPAARGRSGPPRHGRASRAARRCRPGR